MKFIIMRHGDADFSAKTDFDRRLTSRGIQRVNKILDALAAKASNCSWFPHADSQQLIIDGVYTSPITRAKQTCDIAINKLGYKGLVVETNVLMYGANFAQTIEFFAKEFTRESTNNLTQRSGFNTVMLFTHQPLVSHFSNALIGKPSNYLVFDTASVVVLSSTGMIAPGCFELDYQIHANDL